MPKVDEIGLACKLVNEHFGPQAEVRANMSCRVAYHYHQSVRHVVQTQSRLAVAMDRELALDVVLAYL